MSVQALEATSNAFVGHRWGMHLANMRIADRAVGRPPFLHPPLHLLAPSLLSAHFILAQPRTLLNRISQSSPLRHFAPPSSQSPSKSPSALSSPSQPQSLSPTTSPALARQPKSLPGCGERLTGFVPLSAQWRLLTLEQCYICYAISTCLATLLLAIKTTWSVFLVHPISYGWNAAGDSPSPSSAASSTPSPGQSSSPRPTSTRPTRGRITLTSLCAPFVREQEN